MDSLRLTLIIIGLIVVAGIYFKFRSADDDFLLWLKNYLNPANKQTHPASNTSADDSDLIPVLTPVYDEPDLADFEALSRVISGRDRVEEYSKQSELTFSATEDTGETGPESLLIILYIMSPKGHVFTGSGIHAVMVSAGLTHGEHQIYHYLQDGIAVFSIANAIEPGFFELSQLDSIATPGLAVFLELPGPMECRKAFEKFLELSKRLADALSGELCDEHRSVLTPQTISHLKDKIETYRVKQHSAQRSKRK
ncbi:MAG: cell division protein ZipA C-terminal FtsZ-binding domain-containing protein [Gammaproteobacteria bacterium]|nr:cell division protein ZipA C-terminal FtsZ-binding domain-containing protein [Gammaproteobacteria bacterium]